MPISVLQNMGRDNSSSTKEIASGRPIDHFSDDEEGDIEDVYCRTSVGSMQLKARKRQDSVSV